MLEREIREMAFVPRWSIVRTNRQQYLAEHTFFVAMYANDLGVYLGLDDTEMRVLLQASLWHDMEEMFSGDLPGPCKRAGMGEARKEWDRKLTGWLDKVFVQRDTRDGQDNSLPPRRVELIEAIIKLADYIDECSEMGVEIQMGNSTVISIYADSLQRVENAIEAVILADGREPGVINWPHFANMCTSACHASRYGESRSTRIFETL